ncbi:hypothetical protein C8N36_1022 [Pelagimonas varians]|uniref:Uncharacterized protein n=1 Tax=Pelagimonas varians TaxID=696760 RepID=A0A238JY77_9RHOB|nr:hypothetical protein C8N36_1022 [Pelagimonas varians]SMX35453.1 hypothetical protein PEV8663_00464 [Pelagimonas varians]
MDLRSLASVAWFADWLCVQLFNRLASYWLPRVHPCRSLCTGGQKRREGAGATASLDALTSIAAGLRIVTKKTSYCSSFFLEVAQASRLAPKIAAGKRADAYAEP